MTSDLLLDREAITGAQTYHFPDQETGMCHHTQETVTLLSFVVEVGKGRLWAAYGPPCEHEFVLYE